MTWRARAVEDFPMQQVVIHLADIRSGQSDYIVQLGPGRDTVLRSVGEGEVGPAGLSLPYEAAEPLRDALDEYLGKPRDDYRAKYEEARDALETERRRVDALLAHARGEVLGD